MLKLPILYRDFEVQVLEREDAAPSGEVGKLAKHRFSVSSEFEVERQHWWSGKTIKEILIHEDSALDKRLLKTGLSVLDTHYGDQVGIFEGGAIENKKLRGDVRFSRSQQGQWFEQDILDGIRKYVSIGYRILKAKLVETNGDVETWHVTRWMPLEVSLIPIPADPTPGYKRAQGTEELYEVEIETDGSTAQEERTMKPELTTAITEPAATPRAADPPKSAAAVEIVTTAERNAEAAEIFELATLHGLSARAPEWIRKGLSKKDVGLEILAAEQTRGSGQPAAEHLPGTEKDLRGYSYRRAIQLLVDRGLDANFDGLEGEVHQELVRGIPSDIKRHGGIQVPMRTRTMDSKTATKGLELVQDQPGELIEILRNQAFVIRNGARVLTGLVGPVPFPKVSGAATVYWVPENPTADVTSSDLAFGQVNLAPKTMQGNIPYTRQLLAQASLDVEAMVREDLGSGHALAIDRAALHGSGVNGEPTGIYIAPDVQSVAMGGVPTFIKIVAMESAVADKNAFIGSLAHITTPLMAGIMMGTLVAAAAGSAMIWTGTFEDGVMAGYPARATNQVSKTLEASTKHGMIFGNWRDLLIGLWNSLELIVDPYTLKKRGVIEVTSFQMGDVALRHGESFCKSTGATIS